VSAAAFLLDFIEREMCLPGQVENWVLLLDLSSTPAPPLKEIRMILRIMQLAFPCRLGAGYLKRGSSRMLWTKITALMTPETSGKFVLLSENCGELWQGVNRGQVEEKWGGTQPNKETYWPPSPAPKDVAAAGFVPVPSDYSSHQEYFPERSLTEGESTEVVQEVCWNEDNEGFWKDAKAGFLSDAIEFEEGLRLCRKLGEPQTLLSHKPVVRHELPLSPSLQMESTEMLTAACCCITKRSHSDCSLM